MEARENLISVQKNMPLRIDSQIYEDKNCFLKFIVTFVMVQLKAVVLCNMMLSKEDVKLNSELFILKINQRDEYCAMDSGNSHWHTNLNKNKFQIALQTECLNISNRKNVYKRNGLGECILANWTLVKHLYFFNCNSTLVRVRICFRI